MIAPSHPNHPNPHNPSSRSARTLSPPAGPRGAASAGNLSPPAPGLLKPWPTASALILAAAITLAASGTARAGCDCLSVSQIVRGAAQSVITGIVGPLDAVIRKAASYETQNLHLDLVALREAVTLNQEAVTAAIRSADRSAAERELERTFDSGSRSPDACGDDEMGGALLGGRETSEKTSEAVMAKLVERRERHERPVDYLVELGDFPEPATAAAILGDLTAGRTLTLEEFKGGERIIEALSDPLPPPDLPQGAAATPAGRVYEARRRDYATRQGLYQSVLARRLADLAPTIEGLGDWAVERWSSMGGTGTPPGLTDGRMSRRALFWLLANSRLASANWHERILPALTEAGVLREIASMMAVGLELARRQDERLESLAAMMALEGLRALESGAGETLRIQRRLALSPGGGGEVAP